MFCFGAILRSLNLRGVIRAPSCKCKRVSFFPKTPKTLKSILHARLQDASFDCLCPTHFNLIKCRRAALLMPNYVFTMQIARSCLFSSVPLILIFFLPRSQHDYVADSCWGVISARFDHKRTEKTLKKELARDYFDASSCMNLVEFVQELASHNASVQGVFVLKIEGQKILFSQYVRTRFFAPPEPRILRGNV